MGLITININHLDNAKKKYMKKMKRLPVIYALVLSS